jgi:allophanate hydrolase
LGTVCDRIEARGEDGVWISRIERQVLCSLAEASTGRGALAGVPFAIKDNIDLLGLATTAACPDFAYAPTRSAFVVRRLLEAGAVPVGKTNLDQFATGLVGVRSPYGVARNPFDANYLPGGSSSGSAVAVAAGLCSFALGTDTAGSGRVPAAFNNLVGLKPTRGLLSCSGVVPACRSLDCVSIFTRTVADAAEVFSVAAGFDPEDPYARHARPPVGFASAKPRIGVPRADQLEFFGDQAAAGLYATAVARWESLGAVLVEVDIFSLLETARLLYEGPWVAERYAAIREFIAQRPESLHPVTRQVIGAASSLGAVGAFEAFHRLEAHRRQVDTLFASIDFLLLPTTPTVYRVEEVLADPIRLNSRLGHYTNFMNLLDLCGLALPAGFLPKGLPWGVTLVAPAFHDDRLLRYGACFLGEPVPATVLAAPGPSVEVAVCGAHLSGLPLNWQLRDLGARLLRGTRTLPQYRLYALPGTVPPKPGLVRTEAGGASIEVEVWELPLAAYGQFVSMIPAPLGIGRLQLEDGTQPQGFLCEQVAVLNAMDISHLGGWRAYMASRSV